MRDYIDVGVLGNWVSMLRADLTGAIWLADDDEEARFYERCKHVSSRVVPAPHLARSLLDLVEARGIQGVVATVRGPVTESQLKSNMFRPSLGDVASLLLTSAGCDKVITDLNGPHWLTASKNDIGSVQCRSAWLAALFERARKRLEEEGNHVESSEVVNVIRWDIFDLDWDRIGERIDNSDLVKSVQIEINAHCGVDPKRYLRLCDGVEAAQILAAAMSHFQPRGIPGRAEVTLDSLMGMLRVAFDLPELEDDDIFWRMREWERQNHRYPLLCQWRALDPLGVVWDQRYWESDLARLISLMSAIDHLAVLKMDLDNFKSVNEKLGHSGGDTALRLYCSVAKNICGRSAEVYRRGGDEVVVLGPRMDEDHALVLAEQVRATIESEFSDWGAKQGLETSPTSSIGVVALSGPIPGDKVVRLLDEAQLQAKQEGKNRVVLRRLGN
jgi:diguanylate cyclase (GGDEF)-like protein